MGMIIDQINLLAFKTQMDVGGVTFLGDKVTYGDDTYDLETVDGAFASVMLKLDDLISSVWTWVIIALAAVAAIWGLWIGIKIAIANKNEEKINSRDMLKNLLIGIIVMAVVAVGVPLLIKALAAWATV